MANDENDWGCWDDEEDGAGDGSDVGGLVMTFARVSDISETDGDDDCPALDTGDPPLTSPYCSPRFDDCQTRDD
jgi:hypothetical protein